MYDCLMTIKELEMQTYTKYTINVLKCAYNSISRN